MKKKCPKARTQKEQQAIHPEEAVKMFKAGNKRFISCNMINYCYKEMAKGTIQMDRVKISIARLNMIVSAL